MIIIIAQVGIVTACKRERDWKAKILAVLGYPKSPAINWKKKHTAILIKKSDHGGFSIKTTAATETKEP